MNFGERFKSHAKTLAEAAKQFQSFDEMAEQDDYIHSDSLNVSTTTSVSESPARKTSELLDSLISPISTLQSDSNPHRRPPNGSIGSSSQNDSSDPLQQETDDSHDPILETLGTQHSLKRKSSDLVSTSAPPSEPEEQRKSANRFLDDLNERLAKPNVDVEHGLPQTSNEDSKSTSTSSDTDSRLGWMKGVLATTKLKDFMGKSENSTTASSFRSPLSRTTSNVAPSKTTSKEEEYNIVQSSALLGEEDQAELDRIRLGTQGDSLTFLLNVIKQNPQFAFLAFTLVLATFMYFYSRHQGAEDDVN